MDGGLLEIIISVILYLVYAFFEHFKGPKKGEEVSDAKALQAEQAHAHQLLARAERGEELLSDLPGWSRRGVGPVWTQVLVPALRRHREHADQAVQEQRASALYELHYRRLKLSDLFDNLASLARTPTGDNLIGFSLVGGLDALQAEAQTALGPGDADVVADPQLDRQGVRRLVAAWSPFLLADILTARLDPTTARELLRQIKALPEVHHSPQPGVPPALIRGQVLAQTLGEPPPRAATDELVLTHSAGARFAIPAAPVLDATREATGTLTRHRWGALGSRTIDELAAAPTQAPAPMHAPTQAAPAPSTPYATPEMIARRKAAELHREARRAAPAQQHAVVLEEPLEATPSMRRSVTIKESVYSRQELGKAVVLSDILPI